ncbi:MAG: glycosyltransferase family 4 protein [bacterium]|nr:glycosyltransferase family 4 protein [bacterium]
MKIGFIIDSGGIGGAEKQAMILASQLKKNGHHVTFFCLNSNDQIDIVKYLDSLNIEFIDLQFSFTYSHISRFQNIIRLCWKLRRYNLDLLLPYTIRPNVNINFAWQLTGAKASIWNQRDDGHGFGKKYRDKILWFALKNTSAFISNSEHGLSFLNDYIDIKQPKKFIKNGIEIPEIKGSRQTIREKIGLNKHDLVVIMVANLTKHKDHKTLLEAWSIFSKTTSYKNPILVLAGKKGDSTEAIQAQITKLEIEKMVYLSGFRKDIHEWLKASDFAVFSSKFEGTPNGFLEAMALSIPIIGTKIEGIQNIFDHDYNYLSEIDDFEQLAGHIKLFAEDPELRKNIAKENLLLVQKKFGVNRLVDEFEEFWKAL